jgi:hypothetical protein
MPVISHWLSDEGLLVCARQEKEEPSPGEGSLIMRTIFQTKNTRKHKSFIHLFI